MLTLYVNELTITGYRPTTITARGRVLKAFEDAIAPRQLRDATRADVEAFLARPLAAGTRRVYLSHLRAFYAWAILRDYLTVDPTAQIARIRVPKSLPRPAEQSDIALALDRAGPRMRAWLLLMALCGLRALEVAALQPGDLLLDGDPLLFLRECKGGGTGIVPAHAAVLEALAVLPIRNGQWWDVSADYVSRQVAAFLRSVGVRATGHQLRHSAATAWYKASGHDLLTTAKLLRHVNVQTTQVYADLDPRRPIEVMRATPVPSQRAS